jgi:hypothetical protein
MMVNVDEANLFWGDKYIGPTGAGYPNTIISSPTASEHARATRRRDVRRVSRGFLVLVSHNKLKEERGKEAFETSE